MDVAVPDSTPPLKLPLRRPRAAPATAFEQKDVTVLGMRLRYIDVPPEREPEGPPVLLIHGHASRIEEYEHFVPHLRSRRRILVPDLPGCGYSDKPHRAYTLRFYEDALLAFLEAVGVDGPADLAGGSLGGNLTLRLGHREGDRFHRLAAWAPAGAWQPAKMAGWALYGRLMKHLPFMFWPSLWIQSRFWYSKDWEGREASYHSIWSFTREVYGPAFRRMYWEIGVDQVIQTLFDHASQIAHETYLAYGEHDHALGMSKGVERLSRMVPRASLRVFEGAKHSLANEIPHLLGPDVERFLHGEWSE